MIKETLNCLSSISKITWFRKTPSTKSKVVISSVQGYGFKKKYRAITLIKARVVYKHRQAMEMLYINLAKGRRNLKILILFTPFPPGRE
jgi:hypothetical protein